MSTVKTKFAVVGKEKGCSNCDNLKAFLQYGLDGEYDDEITFINQEEDPEGYDKYTEQTGAMSLPIIINMENDEWVSGFNPPEIQKLLSS